MDYLSLVLERHVAKGGLEGYWPALDAGADQILDLSGYGRHAPKVATGSGAWAVDNVGPISNEATGATSFNGNYIISGSSPSPSGVRGVFSVPTTLASITLACWIKPAATPVNTFARQSVPFGFFSGGGSPRPAFSYDGYHSTAFPRTSFILRQNSGSGTTNYVTADYTIFQAAKWHHLVGTFDAVTRALKFYVNGTLRANTTIAAFAGTEFSPEGAIGGRYNGSFGDSGNSHFNGAIANCEWWSRVWDADEVAQVNLAGVNGLPKGWMW